MISVGNGFISCFVFQIYILTKNAARQVKKNRIQANKLNIIRKMFAELESLKIIRVYNLQ